MGAAGREVGSLGGFVEKCVSPQAEKHGQSSSHVTSHSFLVFVFSFKYVFWES